MNVGETLEFPCAIEVEEALPPEWFKDGSSLETNQRVSVTANHSVVISGARTDDAGNFTCQWKSGSVVVLYTVLLTVQGRLCCTLWFIVIDDHDGV